MQLKFFLVAILVFTSLTFSATGKLVQRQTLYPNGKIKEHYTCFVDDHNREIKEGLAEEWHVTGEKKGEIHWKNGKEEGAVTYFYTNGRKSYEAYYLDGKKSGYATVWYENGQKQWQTTFQNGKTHGLWREWFNTGKKKFEANYGAGRLEGVATWWYENGKKRQERGYQNGIEIPGHVKEWNALGNQTYPILASPTTPQEDSSANIDSSAHSLF